MRICKKIIIEFKIACHVLCIILENYSTGTCECHCIWDPELNFGFSAIYSSIKKKKWQALLGFKARKKEKLSFCKEYSLFWQNSQS